MTKYLLTDFFAEQQRPEDGFQPVGDGLAASFRLRSRGDVLASLLRKPSFIVADTGTFSKRWPSFSIPLLRDTPLWIAPEVFGEIARYVEKPPRSNEEGDVVVDDDYALVAALRSSGSLKVIPDPATPIIRT